MRTSSKNSKSVSNVNAIGGFTLVEILTVVSIITIMAALTMGALSSIQKKGEMMEDVNAGRTLISAYLAAAGDHDGQLLPAKDNTSKSLTLSDGTTYASPISERYPMRLLPYLGNTFEGSIVTKANRAAVKKQTTKYMADYTMSVNPSFGINQYFVGGIVDGDSESTTVTFAEECAVKLSQLENPIIAFATASASTTGQPGSHGYLSVLPPKTFAPIWSSTTWKSTSKPGSYGNVHARHNGKVVYAMTDGSVHTNSIEELRDMRLWNKNAAAQDNKDYTTDRP